MINVGGTPLPAADPERANDAWLIVAFGIDRNPGQIDIAAVILTVGMQTSLVLSSYQTHLLAHHPIGALVGRSEIRRFRTRPTVEVICENGPGTG